LLIESRDRGGGGFDSDLPRSLEFPLLRSAALQALAPVARRGLSAARAMAAQLLQVLMKFIVDLVGHSYLLDTTSHHSPRAHKQAENVPEAADKCNKKAILWGGCSNSGRVADCHNESRWCADDTPHSPTNIL
jgi:hypothetical protein